MIADPILGHRTAAPTETPVARPRTSRPGTTGPDPSAVTVEGR